MLRVVLPFATRSSVPPVSISVDVPVGIEVSVDIDVNVAVPPAGVAPCITPCGTYGDARGEGKYGSSRYISRRVIVVGRIGRIPPRSVYHGGIINRHVDYLRAGRLDLDDCFLDDDNLLFRRLEVARSLSFCTKTLDGVQDIFLLREEGISQFLCPVEFLAHHVEDLRKIHQGFHARIPFLFLQGRSQGVPF